MANETVYRVMNHAEVVTLKEMVMKNGKLTYEKLCRYLCPVMKDLSKIHEKGIIHGAICPDNIMVNADGEVHLLDLGVAKDLYQSEETQKEDSRKNSSLPFSFEGNLKRGHRKSTGKNAAAIYNGIKEWLPGTGTVSNKWRDRPMDRCVCDVSDDVLSTVRKRPADTDGSSGFRKRKNGSKCNK